MLAFTKKGICFLLVFVVGLTILTRLDYSTLWSVPMLWTLNLTGRIGQQRVLPKTVLLWTPFFGIRDYLQSPESAGCGEMSCQVTSNRSLLEQSDVVVLHARDMNCEDLPPGPHRAWQMWVLLNMESPFHTPGLSCLNGLINWTATYRRDSDLYIPYGSYSPLNPDRPASDESRTLTKTKMAVWLVSNCNTPGRREDFVNVLTKTIPVDIFGQCGKPGCSRNEFRHCNQELASKYYFYLSFENSICTDYVTEKLFNMLEVDIVPVVFGGADYRSVAPPNSYINAQDFRSPAALGQYLRQVASNRSLYSSFLSWKSKYRGGGSDFLVRFVCDVCRKVQQPLNHTVHRDLHRWSPELECKYWDSLSSTFKEFSNG